MAEDEPKYTPEEAYAEAQRRITEAAQTEAKILALNGLGLQCLPPEIGQLTALTELNLSRNQLMALQPELGQLTALTKVDLSRNQLTTLPPELGQLTALTVLNLFDNQLINLPPELGQLTSLGRLFLHNNPTLNLPPEVLGPTADDVYRKNATPARPADILAFYFRMHAEKTRPLNELKILVVGHGSVGKTSLINYLIKGKKADPAQPKTPGIDIRDEIEIRPWSPDGDAVPLRANIWDFGGQEIMHATHQFFLTERSLYLIVLEPRKDGSEQNLQYWLRIVETFGGDSPIFVVINKCDPPNDLDLNATGLKGDHPNIRSVIKTSCISGLGISELKNAIAKIAGSLKHVSDPVPVSYLQVKEALESAKRQENYQTFTQYEALCLQNGIRDTANQVLLLRFLHKLGTVLNYGESDDLFHLRQTNVLNPRWVTDGVYRILNSNAIMQADGVLERHLLGMVFNDPQRFPPGQWDFILGMMEKFDLCFEFPGSKRQRFLVPELLRPNEPELHWPMDDSLKLEYHYEVLPEGVIPRFIVRMHHALTEKHTYWRSGVVLKIDLNMVLVKTDSLRRKITVSVVGPQTGRRLALSAIRNEFAAIHGNIRGITQFIPWPEDPSVLLDYETLLTFERDGIQSMPVKASDGKTHNVIISDVLNGIDVDDSETRRERNRAGQSSRVSLPSEKSRNDQPLPPPMDLTSQDMVAWRTALVWLFGLMIIVGGIVIAMNWLPDWQSKMLTASLVVLLVCVFTYMMTPIRDRQKLRWLLDKVLNTVSTLPTTAPKPIDNTPQKTTEKKNKTTDSDKLLESKKKRVLK